MIELQKAGKAFRIAPGPGRKGGVVHAVRDLTAVLERGELVGVVGPNGAGKTTLFSILLGFMEATSGSVSVGGMHPRRYVRACGASYLPERFSLPREWPVRAALAGLLQLDHAANDIDAVLAEYDLERFAASAAHTLSRGTLQRVGIAQALAAPRALVVLDEPTEGLDPVWRVRLRERLRALRRPDRLVLVASHDISEIERVCDRAIVLQSGTISEIVELGARPAAARDYTIVLASPHHAVPSLFRNVRVTENTYTVTVENAADLNTRLAALIDAGGLIVSVTPAADLEERVTRGNV